jgi:hypothetical protein
VHIIVSWDITNQPEPGAWNMWNERMKEVLKPYAWVRPLGTVYVVPIQYEFERQTINTGLTRVSNQAAGSIHFMVSPAMAGGQYVGVLPQNLWPELNKRSA